MSRVTATGPAVHRCPFVDELDVGTVTVEWDSDLNAVELHALAGSIESFAHVVVTHENFAERLAEHFAPCKVTARFRTAGLDVVCEATT